MIAAIFAVDSQGGLGKNGTLPWPKDKEDLKWFKNNTTGTFKRVINPTNLIETTSKYYIRKHKIITNVNDCILTKNAFEKNVFNEEKKFEYSSITPNQVSRISQKTSSNAYSVTSAYDIDIAPLKDNQKRPISELFLTIVHKGYTGYFYDPNYKTGIKRGWEFNLTSTSNPYWDRNNQNSDSNIPISTYTKTQSGQVYTFAYSNDLKKDDIIDGDFCEWNNFNQIERVVSTYQHKIKYNQNLMLETGDIQFLIDAFFRTLELQVF